MKVDISLCSAPANINGVFSSYSVKDISHHIENTFPKFYQILRGLSLFEIVYEISKLLDFKYYFSGLNSLKSIKYMGLANLIFKRWPSIS